MPVAILLKNKKLELSQDMFDILGVKTGEYLIAPAQKSFQTTNQRSQQKVDELYGFLEKYAKPSSLGLSDKELDEAIEKSKKNAFKNVKTD